MTPEAKPPKAILWAVLLLIVGAGPAARLLRGDVHPGLILAVLVVGGIVLAVVYGWRRMQRGERVSVVGALVGLLIGAALAVPVAIGAASLVPQGMDRAMLQLPLVLGALVLTPVLGAIIGLIKGMRRASDAEAARKQTAFPVPGQAECRTPPTRRA